MKKSAKKALELVEEHLLDGLMMDQAELQAALDRRLYNLAGGVAGQITSSELTLRFVRSLLGECPIFEETK